MPATINLASDLQQLAGWAMALGHNQLPFATSVALNAVAQDAADEVGRETARRLDRPTPFTRRAWSVWKSSKAQLTATVYAKDAQARYLRWQVAGGSRAPNKRAQRLPSNIKLNEFGNLPRGEIARLVALAKSGKRLTKARGARLGVSSKLDLFYGDPGNGLPPGIYKRVVHGTDHKLVPLIVFPRVDAKYTVRLPLERIVRDVVRARFEQRFHQAWAAALRTAR